MAKLAQSTTIFLIIDGSTVGRGCVTLMVSVVYKKRALPIAWSVLKGNKGHLPDEIHMKLIEQVHQIIPKEAKVVFLGDGGFDGVNFLAQLQAYGWDFICRTAKTSVLFKANKKLSFQDLPLIPGQPPIYLPNVFFTL